MLLRWLVNQYLQDGAQGKVREVVNDFVRGAVSRPPTPDSRSPAPDHRPTDQPTTDHGPSSAAFLPTDIVFLFALGIEAGGLVDLTKGVQTARQPHGTEHAGKLAGREIVIVEAGIGEKAAARAAAEALKFYEPRYVISAGFAGALDANLKRGHILMADEVVNAAGERLAVGLKLSAESKGLHVGRLLTVGQLVTTPAERQRLAAEHAAVACDMETFAVAKVCAERGVPLLSVRIISDAADEELPPEIDRLMRQTTLAGKIGAAAGAVLQRFSAAKDMWQLREDALKASDRLGKFLVGIAGNLP